MNDTKIPDEKVRARLALKISSQDAIYYLSLALLFAGLWMVYGLGQALVVLGSIGVGVSICTSFYVTWLSSKGMTNATKTK